MYMYICTCTCVYVSLITSSSACSDIPPLNCFSFDTGSNLGMINSILHCLELERDSVVLIEWAYGVSVLTH